MFAQALRVLACAVLAALGVSSAQAAPPEVKPRVMVLTDIENEPDDALSLVRFLVYANHYEVEGLAATTSTHLRARVAPERIRRIVSAYGKVRDNLETHERGFPTGDALLARVTAGPSVYGMQGVGAGKDSWTVKPYAQANHPPAPRVAQQTITARPGQRVELSAQGSTDPDGDALSYAWSCYCEAGTLVASSGKSGQPLEITGADQQKAWFTVPTTRVLAPGLGTMHIVLAVTDHGTPRLTRYQRVIVDVRE